MCQLHFLTHFFLNTFTTYPALFCHALVIMYIILPVSCTFPSFCSFLCLFVCQCRPKKRRNGLILQKNTTLDHITNCKHPRLPATAFLGKKEKLTGKFSLCIVLKCMVDVFVGIFIIASEYSKLFTTKRRKKWTLTVTVLSFTL